MFLGYALRLYQLDQQSLWNDETYSVDLANQGLAAIWLALATADSHPPLYFELLHFWARATGETELAVRYLSVVAGTLAVPLIYQLGRALLNRQVAVVAALLATVSPVHVHYSQETRMYALAATLTVLSTYGLLRALRDGRASDWVMFASAAILDLYTHYYAVFVLAFQALFALGWVYLRKRQLTQLLLAGAAIFVVYLPWLLVLLTQYGSIKSFYEGPMDFERVWRETLEGLGLGSTADRSLVLLASRVAASLAVVGLLSLSFGAVAEWRAARGGAPRLQAALLLGGYWLVPLALMVVLLTQKPKYGPQHVLLVWPAFTLLVANGLLAPLELGRRRAGAIAARFISFGLVLAAIAMSLLFLKNELQNASYARDDWRAVAGYVRSQCTETDGILLLAGYAAPSLRYYDPGCLWVPVLNQQTLNMAEVVDDAELSRVLEAIGGRQRIWLIEWQADVADPNGLVANLFYENAGPPAVVREFGTIKVQRYDLPEGKALSAGGRPAHALDVNFGDLVALIGYDPPAKPVPAGGAAEITLYWKALRPLDDDYFVAVWLADGAGHEWGRASKRPASELYYTKRWKVGSVVAGTVDVPVLAGAPPVDYALHARLFSIATMKSLDVMEGGSPKGTDFAIGRIVVSRPPAAASYQTLGLPSPLAWNVAPGITLLGALVADSEVRAGEPIRLTTHWEAVTAPTRRGRLELELKLIGSEGTELAQQRELLGMGYPTDRWLDGERLRGQHSVRAPAAALGKVRVLGRLFDSETGAPVSAAIPAAEVTVRGRGHNTTQAPLPRVTQQTQVGESFALLGYDLDRTSVPPGGTVNLRLFWRAVGTAGESYKVFTHLLDSDNTIWAQQDSIPGQGTMPTSSWIAGEFVADDYQLKVKPDAPPGEYVLEVGMYLDPNGPRLATLDGARAGDNIVLRDRIRVVGR